MKPRQCNTRHPLFEAGRTRSLIAKSHAHAARDPRVDVHLAGEAELRGLAALPGPGLRGLRLPAADRRGRHGRLPEGPRRTREASACGRVRRRIRRRRSLSDPDVPDGAPEAGHATAPRSLPSSTWLTPPRPHRRRWPGDREYGNSRHFVLVHLGLKATPLGEVTEVWSRPPMQCVSRCPQSRASDLACFCRSWPYKGSDFLTDAALVGVCCESPVVSWRTEDGSKEITSTRPHTRFLFRRHWGRSRNRSSAGPVPRMSSEPHVQKRRPSEMHDCVSRLCRAQRPADFRWGGSWARLRLRGAQQESTRPRVRLSRVLDRDQRRTWIAQDSKLGSPPVWSLHVHVDASTHGVDMKVDGERT
jgi:hypothetical protein